MIGNKLERVQFLTGNSLKIVACLTMFVDHFSKILVEMIMSEKLFPLYLNGGISGELFYRIDDFQRSVLNGIGTIAFPLFCLLLAEGFVYTKNRKRYIGFMLIFALISEIPFDISFFSFYSRNEGTFPFYFGYQNVFFTLLLGLVCLFVLERLPQFEKGQERKENIKAVLLQVGVVAVVAVAAELLKCDYGSQGIIYIAGFYLFRKSRILQAVAFLVLFMATTGNQPTMYIMIAVLLILLYNGKRGKLKVKYLFYWFYPVHIFGLYVIARLLV